MIHIGDKSGRMESRMTSALVYAIVLAVCSKGLSATCYVDQASARSSDDNPGTQEQPWKTINHAATVLEAGDTVLVKAGTYDVGASENWAVPAVNPSHSGTKDKPVTFRAVPGDRVIITTSGGQSAIGSNSRDYITWEGFIVDMVDRLKGVQIQSAKGCVLAYCEVIGNYMPTNDNHDGIRIERAPDCTIHHCIIRGIKGNSPNSAGIKLYSKGSKNVIVEDNHIHDNTAGVFDKDFGVQNTYRRNYFTRNRTDFYGNNQGGPAVYDIYDNVFDGRIELHGSNAGTQVHDNLVRSDRLVGAWAGGVLGVRVWNNITLGSGASLTGCDIKKAVLHDAVTYMDYNLYDAGPRYAFGEYTDNPRKLSLAEMRREGFEAHSYVVPGRDDLFGDAESWQLAPRWRETGRYGDSPGPQDIAAILNLERYGPSGRNRD